MASEWFLYMIRTQADRLYTGISTDVERRFQQHASGKGAKFFRGDPPLEVVYWQRFADRSQASVAEWHTKQLTRQQKLALIRERGDSASQPADRGTRTENTLKEGERE